MNRKLIDHSSVVNKDILPVSLGGTGIENISEVSETFGFLKTSLADIANGYATTNTRRKVLQSQIPDVYNQEQTISIVGETTVTANSANEYIINNYDSSVSYNVTAVTGLVSISGNTVTYTAPDVDGIGGFSINGKSYTLNVIKPTPVTPNITSPVNGATNIGPTLTITSSVFGINVYSDTHESSDWEIATDNNFSNIVVSSFNDVVNLTSWVVNLPTANITYYIRARHKGAVYGFSDYSSVIQVTAKVSFLPTAEEVILTASDKNVGDSFGTTVTISSDGTRVVVGAYGASPGGISSAGKAYIFTRSGTTWTQEAILTASDKAVGDRFGYSVAISSDGTRTVVGAFLAENSSIVDAGKAYIFTRSGTIWTEEAILTASDKTASDRFGKSVSISGDGSRVIIGSHNGDPSGIADAGKAYIYSRTGTTWTEEAILTASDKATGDNFGVSVAINSDGSRVAAGAIFASPSGISNAGKAYIFSRTGTTWSEEVVLTASDKTVTDYFGCLVAINSDGSRVIIGSYNGDPSGINNAGKAYIFSRSGTTWAEETILTASDKIGSNYFGISVTISGDGSTAVVGAYAASPGNVTRAGKSYIFSRSGTTWTEKAILTASDKAASDYFGSSVAISSDGSRTVVGAYLADPSGFSQAGKAYIFS